MELYKNKLKTYPHCFVSSREIGNKTIRGGDFETKLDNRKSGGRR
jgi:hypothetical protein